MNPQLHACLLMGASLMVAGAARASTIPVTGDATVSSIAPGTNFGGTANLVVNSTSNALLQFPLGSLPPGVTSSVISKATLVVYVNRVNTAGALVAQQVNFAGFTEGTVTYSNGPGIGSSSTAVVVSAGGTFVTFDVTAQVQSMISNTAYTNFYFNLAPGNGGKSPVDVRIDSKENDSTGHSAVLDIVIGDGATAARWMCGSTARKTMRPPMPRCWT